MTKSLKQQIELHRRFWSDIAKKNKWYKSPFFIQVWVEDGKVTDSVSFKGISKDYIINNNNK